MKSKLEQSVYPSIFRVKVFKHSFSRMISIRIFGWELNMMFP